jgi:hypothetical protein
MPQKVAGHNSFHIPWTHNFARRESKKGERELWVQSKNECFARRENYMFN